MKKADCQMKTICFYYLINQMSRDYIYFALSGSAISPALVRLSLATAGPTSS